MRNKKITQIGAMCDKILLVNVITLYMTKGRISQPMNVL